MAEIWFHHLDAQLGGQDAAGDEGAIFAKSLLEGPVGTEELAALKSEDDSGFITIGGKQVAVEFHGYGGTGSNSASGGTDSDSSSGSSGGSSASSSNSSSSSSGSSGSSNDSGKSESSSSSNDNKSSDSDNNKSSSNSDTNRGSNDNDRGSNNSNRNGSDSDNDRSSSSNNSSNNFNSDDDSYRGSNSSSNSKSDSNRSSGNSTSNSSNSDNDKTTSNKDSDTKSDNNQTKPSTDGGSPGPATNFTTTSLDLDLDLDTEPDTDADGGNSSSAPTLPKAQQNSNALSGVSDWFNDKREDLVDLKEDIVETVDDAADAIANKADEIGENISDVADAIDEKFDEVSEKIAEEVEDVKEWTAEVEEEYNISTRAMAGVGLVGDIAVGAAGVVGMVAPEPVTTVAGAVATANAVNNGIANIQTIITGKEQETLLEKGVAETAELLGATEDTAETVGNVVQTAADFVNPAGASKRAVSEVTGVGKGGKVAGVSKVSTKEVDYSRPTGYRSGVRDEVWDTAKEQSTGQVRDPGTGQFMSKDKSWDMGHKPGFEYRKHEASARERGISREQLLDEHNTPEHFRPELPSSNRNHKSEDLTDTYLGPKD